MESVSNNPKTSSIGVTIGTIIMALAGYVAINQDLFAGMGAAKWIVSGAMFIVGGGFAGLGLAAKDGDKGGNAPNEKIDAVIPPPIDPKGTGEKYE